MCLLLIFVILRNWKIASPGEHTPKTKTAHLGLSRRLLTNAKVRPSQASHAAPGSGFLGPSARAPGLHTTRDES